MIINASCRTDIPAFYSEWFLNRLREGYVLVRNPYFPGNVSRISLKPEDVDAVVFWTKNALPMMDKLDSIESFLPEIPYLFEYTVTPYGPEVEPWTAETPKPAVIDNFITLSERISSEKMIWRFDPVILSSAFSPEYYAESFETIAESLEGASETCIISFMDSYKRLFRKVNPDAPGNSPEIAERNAFLLGIETTYGKNKNAGNLSGIYDLSQNSEKSGKSQKTAVSEIPESLVPEVRNLAKELAKIGKSHGFSLQTCSEKINLSDCGIKKGACVDRRKLESICSKRFSERRSKPNRPECLCMEAADIGAYGSCLADCLYCYADSKKSVIGHDPASPMLLGNLRDGDIVTERKVCKTGARGKQTTFDRSVFDFSFLSDWLFSEQTISQIQNSITCFYYIYIFLNVLNSSVLYTLAKSPLM